MLYSQATSKCPFLARVTSTFLRKCGPSLRTFASRCPVMSDVLKITQPAATLHVEATRPEYCPFHAPDFPCRSDCLSSHGNHCSLDFTNPRTKDGASVGNVARTPSGPPLAKEDDAKVADANKCPFSHLFEQVDDKETKETTKSGKGFDFEAFFGEKLDEKRKDDSYRIFKTVQRLAAGFPRAENYYKSPENHIQNMREVTIWCANDYLGMSRHSDVLRAAKATADKYGVGAGGTRNISGNGILHEALEAGLADLHGKDAALLFTSCYNANDTTLTVLGNHLPNLIYFSDAGNHRSMIEGIRHSGAKKVIFRHNDVAHLEQLLSEADPAAPKIVAFESVYSMAGTISPLKQICDVAHKYGALTFVDEVHAVGLYGHCGAGYGQEIGAADDIDIISGTLGKAFGVHGGYIAGGRNLVDAVRSYGAGFIFTTALPPMNVAAALASIQILRGDEGRELRARHRSGVAMVKGKLTEAGIPIGVVPSHIVPVEVNNAKACQRVCDDLLAEHRIYVQGINYPTVRRGEERLRVTPGPYHTTQMANEFVDALLAVWRKHGLALRPASGRSAAQVVDEAAKLIPGQVVA